MKLCRYENELQVVLEKVHDQQLHLLTLEQQTATPLWTYATVCDRLQGPATMLETRNAEEGKGSRNARQANQHNNPSAQQHGKAQANHGGGGGGKGKADAQSARSKRKNFQQKASAQRSSKRAHAAPAETSSDDDSGPRDMPDNFVPWETWKKIPAETQKLIKDAMFAKRNKERKAAKNAAQAHKKSRKNSSSYLLPTTRTTKVDTPSTANVVASSSTFVESTRPTVVAPTNLVSVLRSTVKYQEPIATMFVTGKPAVPTKRKSKKKKPVAIATEDTSPTSG